MRYRGLVALALTLLSISAGAAAAKLLDGRMPLTPMALSCLGAGVVLLTGDLLVRRFGKARGFWARYLGREAAWSLRGVLPLWVLGFTLLVAALSFPTP